MAAWPDSWCAVNSKTDAPDLQIHVVLDNYATHKHAKVFKWLAKHPRFHMHFTATSASWMNMVERFFRNLSENRLKRGVFKSVDELAAAIELFVLSHNEDPKALYICINLELVSVSECRRKNKFGQSSGM